MREQDREGHGVAEREGGEGVVGCEVVDCVGDVMRVEVLLLRFCCCGHGRDG